MGLDFLNSRALPVDAEIEWIGSGEDLVSWMQAAELVPPEVVAALRKAAGSGEFDAVASRARKLREWFRGFVRKHLGSPLKPRVLQELEPLNRVLVRDEQFGQVVARDSLRKGKSKQYPNKDAPSSRLVGVRGGAGDLRTRFYSPSQRQWPIWSATKIPPTTRLHAAVRGSDTRACTAVVQHGGLRKSRQAGGPSRTRAPRA
jgi:hypothetical protein